MKCDIPFSDLCKYYRYHGKGYCHYEFSHNVECPLNEEDRGVERMKHFLQKMIAYATILFSFSLNLIAIQFGIYLLLVPSSAMFLFTIYYLVKLKQVEEELKE